MSVVSPAQLDWLSHEPETASAVRPSSPISTTAAAGKLWLCLHLPDLPLEVLEGYEPDEAVVVTEVVGQRVEVSAASPAACQGGIEIGMSQAAAQALCPTLRLEPCDPGTELLRLEALARWLGGWSSWVSVVPPSRLLLEVGGSQKLFGGLCEIQRSIPQGWAHMGTVCRPPSLVRPEQRPGWRLGKRESWRQMPIKPAKRLPLCLFRLWGCHRHGRGVCNGLGYTAWVSCYACHATAWLVVTDRRLSGSSMKR